MEQHFNFKTVILFYFNKIQETSGGDVMAEQSKGTGSIPIAQIFLSEGLKRQS